MTTQPANPFRRVYVDHLTRGITRVWWEIDPTFTADAQFEFKLQASYAGHENAIDWEDLTDWQALVTVLTHDVMREAHGKKLLTHYRVLLRVTDTVYASAGEPIWGILPKKDWLLGREIIRREKLRLSLVHIDGFLLRKLRYGKQDMKSTFLTTGDVIDTHAVTSWGTALEHGYHPPVAQDVDMDPVNIRETRESSELNDAADIRPVRVRIMALPDVAKEDIWVHAYTDERYLIEDVQNVAALRGVPLVRSVTMQLLPRSHVAYQIPIDMMSFEPPETEEFSTVVGKGCVFVNHDYGGEDALTYQATDCCGIPGAKVEVFSKEDWDNELRSAEHIVAKTVTTTGGRWADALRLNEGEYVIRFEKVGSYGPDYVTILVEGPPAPETNAFTGEFVTKFGTF